MCPKHNVVVVKCCAMFVWLNNCTQLYTIGTSNHNIFRKKYWFCIQEINVFNVVCNVQVNSRIKAKDPVATNTCLHVMSVCYKM